MVSMTYTIVCHVFTFKELQNDIFEEIVNIQELLAIDNRIIECLLALNKVNIRTN